MRSCATALCALLANICPAQAAGTTLPPGISTTEGGDYDPVFASTPSFRAQIRTASLRNAPGLLRQIDFRPDGQLGLPFAVARTWSKVRVYLGDHRGGDLSRTFSANIGSTPVLAFSGSVSWPDLSKQPLQAPMPWGHQGMTLPLTASYYSTGLQDLLIDFQFAGGTSSFGSWTSLLYPLDAISYRDTEQGPTRVLGRLSCPSPLASATVPDHHAASFVSYPAASSSSQTSGMIGYQVVHRSGGVRTAYIGALGMQGFFDPTLGIDIGACHPLMLFPIALYPFSTDAQGGWNGPSGYYPYQTHLVGAQVWAQAAHAFGTQRIHVSKASVGTIPPRPSAPYPRQMCHAGGASQPQGVVTRIRVPVLRLR